MAPGPVEQILEEVEQTGVGPLEVFEYEDGRRHFGQTLEEDPPGREEVLLVSGRAFLEAEEMGETRLDPRPLVTAEDVLLECEPQLRVR